MWHIVFGAVAGAVLTYVARRISFPPRDVIGSVIDMHHERKRMIIEEELQDREKHI